MHEYLPNAFLNLRIMTCREYFYEIALADLHYQTSYPNANVRQELKNDGNTE